MDTVELEINVLSLLGWL